MSQSDPLSSVVPRVGGEHAEAGVHVASAVIRRSVQWGANGLVTLLFAPWIALLASGPKFLLGVILLDIPLEIDTNFAHLDAPASMGALGGFEVSLTTIALAGLYAGWVLESVLRHPRPTSGPSVFRLTLPLTAYVLVVLVSIVAAEDLGLYARGVFLTIQMFLLFLYLVTWIRTREDVSFIVTMLLGGLVLESLIILGAGPTEMSGLHVRMVTSDDSTIGARFSGTLGSPVDAGAYLSLLLAPAIGVLASALGRPSKMVAVAGLCLGSIALIGTLSRAAWLVAIVSVSLTWLMLRRRGKVPLVVPCLIVASVLFVGLFFQATIVTRLTGDDSGSARGRVPLMVTALDIIEDHPILGVGANNYVAALEHYQSTFTGDWLYTVHNKYLLVWAETGIGGLVAFLWFFLATIRRGWDQWQRCDPVLSPIALGFTAALAARLLHMFVDIFSDRPETQLVWVIAALIFSMARMETRRSM